MSSIINPQIKIKVFTEYGDYEFLTDDMEIGIEKDLDEEPNEAEVIIHNLDKDMRKTLVEAGNETAPIEIHLTQFGTTDFVLAFSGEILRARNSIPTIDEVQHTVKKATAESGAGLQTIIRCTGQKENHRAFFIDAKVFPAGTSYSAIINWLADQVGLPTQIGALPEGTTKYSYSMSGTAFKMLKQYGFDFGITSYILNGKLVITDRYSPQDVSPIVMDDSLLITEPEATTRDDSEQVEIQTVRLNKLGNISKKRRKKKLHGPSEYISHNSVDLQIEGREGLWICQPSIEPDDLITSLGEVQRVQSIEHDCSNFGHIRWQTTINSDLDLASV